MKYVIRRLLVSPVVVGLVAVAYTLLYAYLVAIGGEPTSSVNDVFGMGIGLGILVSIVFIVSPVKKDR